MLSFLTVANHGIFSLRQWGRALWSSNPLSRAKGQSDRMFRVGLMVKVKGVSRTSVIKKGYVLGLLKQ